MKYLYLVLFICLAIKVKGFKTVHKGFNTISVEPVEYGPGKNYYNAGVRKTIICKGSDKNQKIEWVDPSGETVSRLATNRVFVQEYFIPAYKSRIPAAVLTFTNVLADDSGVWECHAGGKKKEVSLCIIDPAEFVDTPTEVTMDLGRSITLTCQARGEPEPRLVWYRNGEIIDDTITSKYALTTKYNSQGFEGLLTVRSLERDDSGVYTCEALQNSPHDEDCSATKSLNITLNINYGPVFIGGNDTSVLFVKENENIELVCSAVAFPEPTYRWFKEIAEVLTEIPQSMMKVDDDGTRSSITLKGNNSLYGQRYKCRATNQYGSVSKDFAIQRLERPQAPVEIVINNSSSNSIQLTLVWEDEAFFQVTGLIIQYLETPSNKRRGSLDWKKANEVELNLDDFDSIESEVGGTVTVSELNEDTTYWLRVRSTNDAGWSSWSSPIKAQTDIEPDVEETSEEIPVKMSSVSHDSEARFYGLLFAGGVLVVAFGSMFVVRVV